MSARVLAVVVGVAGLGMPSVSSGLLGQAPVAGSTLGARTAMMCPMRTATCLPLPRYY